MIRSTITRTSTLAPSREPKPAKGPRMMSCRNRACRKRFTPDPPWMRCCSLDCGVIIGMEAVAKQRAKKERAERATDRARKVAMKSRAQWLKEAQTAFNAWIRQRDAALPCISCGRHHDGKYDAGHFRSVGAMPALRFNEANVHKQCVPCNQHKGGNVVEYRIRLRQRIGDAAVDLLEQDYPPAKFTIEQARAIKTEYVEKLKQLKEAV